ncbi:hypothetical protein ACTWQL_13765 [Pseudalkalibacillus sp. R45]|uniref:hypothetical protein n=1 Tax=Pseudalkalibacillus sp. R45 TaxID=3457433 RepID=UPI003FCE1A71
MPRRNENTKTEREIQREENTNTAYDDSLPGWLRYLIENNPDLSHLRRPRKYWRMPPMRRVHHKNRSNSNENNRNYRGKNRNHERGYRSRQQTRRRAV